MLIRPIISSSRKYHKESFGSAGAQGSRHPLGSARGIGVYKWDPAGLKSERLKMEKCNIKLKVAKQRRACSPCSLFSHYSNINVNVNVDTNG